MHRLLVILLALPLSAQADDVLSAEAQRQYLVRQKLDAVSRKLDLLVRDLEANELTDEGGGAALARLRGHVTGLRDGEVTSAAAALERARSGEARRGDEVALANRHVRDINRRLDTILGQVAVPGTPADLARELGLIVEQQQRLREQTRQLPGRKFRDEGQAQQERARLSAQQQRLAQDVKNLAQAAEQASLDQPDAEAAAALRQAAKELDDPAVRAAQAEAAEKIQENRPAEAAQRQSQAIEAMERAAEQLRQAAEQAATTRPQAERGQPGGEALALADKQAALRQATEQASGDDADALARLQRQQEQLAQAAAALGQGESPSDEGESEPGDAQAQLDEAAKRMEQAAEALGRGDQSESVEQQQAAENALRQAAQAMADAPPPSNGEAQTADQPGSADGGEGQAASQTPATSAGQGGGDESGHAATDQSHLPLPGGEARWRALSDRQRQALNQNFARELPIEYRQLLKDYYESLAAPR